MIHSSQLISQFSPSTPVYLVVSGVLPLVVSIKYPVPGNTVFAFGAGYLLYMAYKYRYFCNAQEYIWHYGCRLVGSWHRYHWAHPHTNMSPLKSSLRLSRKARTPQYSLKYWRVQHIFDAQPPPTGPTTYRAQHFRQNE